MFKKSLIAAGLILTVALLTACGSSAPKQEETTTPAETTQVETAQVETTTEAEKVITDKNTSPKKTDSTEKETTTKKEEKETTTKAPETEKETTTQAAQEAQAPTEAFAVAQYEDEGGAVEMEAYSAYYGVVSADGDGLTLRENPDSGSGGLTLIPDGTEIAIEEVEDGWGLVSYDGMTGWVALEYVE